MDTVKTDRKVELFARRTIDPTTGARAIEDLTSEPIEASDALEALAAVHLDAEQGLRVLVEDN